MVILQYLNPTKILLLTGGRIKIRKFQDARYLGEIFLIPKPNQDSDQPPGHVTRRFKEGHCERLHPVDSAGIGSLPPEHGYPPVFGEDHLEIWVLKNYHDKNQEWVESEYKVETTIIYGRDTLSQQLQAKLARGRNQRCNILLVVLFLGVVA
ncbi:hypothetical protein ACFX1R_006406 [Malus domestica]